MEKSSNRKGRIDDQLAFIQQCDVDVVLLQEVRYGTDSKWLKLWKDGLKEQGLSEIAHSCDWAASLSDSTIPPHSDIKHDNGHLTAVNSDWELTRREQTIQDNIEKQDWAHFDTHFPEKILVTTLETPNKSVDLWNVRAVPGNGWGEEKIKIFETVYNRLTTEGVKTRILAGDFNSPDDELSDGQAIPFGYDKEPTIRQRWVRAELSILKGLGHLDMQDVFRRQHGYGEINTEDTSWGSKRFDHIFASAELSPRQCYYDHGGCDHSDHAPIIAEFEV